MTSSADPLILEVPEVERALDLVVGDDVLAEDRERRDVEDGAAPPPAGFLAGRAPGPDRAPVVRDQDRIGVAAERLVQRDLVGDHRAGVDVVAVIGKLGRREPAVERGHRPVAGVGQRREQIAVAVRRVREPVNAQRQRAVALRQVLERQLVGPDGAPIEFLHDAAPFGRLDWRVLDRVEAREEQQPAARDGSDLAIPRQDPDWSKSQWRAAREFSAIPPRS